MLLKEASLVIGRQKKGLSMEKSFLFYARVLVVGSGISRALVPHRRRTWRQGVHGPVLKCLDTDFFPHRFPFTVLGPALGANFETPFKSAWIFVVDFPMISHVNVALERVVGFFPIIIIIALNSSGLKKYSYIQSKWEEKKEASKVRWVRLRRHRVELWPT